MKKSRRQSFCHTHSFWLFVLPSLALFAVFFLVPLVLSIWFSFTNYDGWKTMDVIGLKNYTDILKDFSKKHGGDIYILPLSIHEVILIPADKISDLTKLYEAVSGANSNFVAETDILSNSIYFYDRSKDQIQTLSEENFGK